jgi:hypothetical protein
MKAMIMKAAQEDINTVKLHRPQAVSDEVVTSVMIEADSAVAEVVAEDEVDLAECTAIARVRLDATLVAMALAEVSAVDQAVTAHHVNPSTITVN